MTWNHRVILHRHERGDYFEVHEVYYNDAGVPDSWTQEPVSIVSESLADMREELLMMLQALDTPILEIVGDKLQEVGKGP